MPAYFAISVILAAICCDDQLKATMLNPKQTFRYGMNVIGHHYSYRSLVPIVITVTVSDVTTKKARKVSSVPIDTVLVQLLHIKHEVQRLY